jgi:hypothetical protein
MEIICVFAEPLVAGLAGLAIEARKYKAAAFAQSTQASYRTHLHTYLRYCIFYGLVPVPAVQSTLTCYLAHLARSYAPKTVDIYMNIVRIIHEEAGVPNPLAENYEMKMMKKGLLRIKGLPPKQKAPVTVSLLLKIHATLDLSLTSDIAFLAATLVGFYGYLRKSSLLPAEIRTPKGKRLSRCDVMEVCVDSFLLVCKHSKSNQFGQRVHTIHFASCVDPRICPVQAVYTHLRASKLHPDSPLFNYVELGVQRFMSHAFFVARLKTAVQLVAVNPEDYSAHSLRRGGASLSFACNVPADHIKARGDWASMCYEKYIVLSAADRLKVARALSVGAASLVDC